MRLRSLFFSTLVGPALLSQGVDISPQEEQALNSLVKLLNTPVIVASRFEQPLSEAHSTVRVFSGKDLRLLGATTLADALKLVAGLDVYFEYDQMKTSVGARGLKGDLVSKRMLFLLDGRPLNLPVNGDFDFDLRMPIAFIKQVEIIRGPGSSLYGANAFLGIVNIRTMPPPEVSLTGQPFESALRGGSFGENHASFAFGHTLSPQTDFSLWGTAAGSNEYGILEKWYRDRIPSGTTDISEGYFLSDFRMAWRHRNLTFNGGVTSSRVDHNNKGQFTQDEALPLSETRQDNLRTRFASLAYDQPLGTAWKVGLQGFINSHDNDRIYSGATRDLHGKEKLWGLQVQAQWRPRKDFRLLVGLDHLSKGSDNDQRTYLQNAQTRETAVFTEAGWTPRPWLDMVLGGRYDRHSEFSGQFSPRASLIARFLSEGRVRLSYATAFRAPTFTELFLTESKGFDAKPETIRTTELAVSYLFGDVRAAVTAFDNRVHDQIYFISTARGYGNQEGMVYSRGLELEMEAVLAWHWRPFLSFTLQRSGSDVPGDRYENELVAAPTRKLTGGVTVCYSTWEASMSGYWIDRQRDGFFDPTRGNESPSYTALNARVAWTPRSWVSLALITKNALNRRYYDKGHDPRFTDPADYRSRNNDYPARSLLGEARFRW